MGTLIYAANTSLDGYLEDEAGSFDWSVPDDDVHAFWNEHERHIGTSLYGRRMYETMRVWESDDWLTTEPAVVREYAEIWRDTDKVVYSSTLDAVSTARTRIERQFEPEAVRQLKETSRLGPEHRRRDPRGRGVPARARRRVRAAPVPRARRRRQAGAAPGRTTRPRAARPSTVRQWCDLRAPRGTNRFLTPWRLSRVSGCATDASAAGTSRRRQSAHPTPAGATPTTDPDLVRDADEPAHGHHARTAPRPGAAA